MKREKEEAEKGEKKERKIGEIKIYRRINFSIKIERKIKIDKSYKKFDGLSMTNFIITWQNFNEDDEWTKGWKYR